jgi:hypothetical protein
VARGVRDRAEEILGHGLGFLPAASAQGLADGLLVNAQLLCDGAVGRPFALQAEDLAAPRCGQSRAALRVSARTAQSRQSPFLETALLATQRALGAPEGPGDILLMRPTTIDDVDHREGAGHSVGVGELRDGQT